tara:strand:- start:11511 stop:12080 length:570 start_codon:yes stop_codon:yes gene_type:complete
MAYWTKEEDKELISLYNEGHVIRVIALKMGKTVGSISQRVVKLRKAGVIAGRQKKTNKDRSPKQIKENLKSWYKQTPYEKPWNPYEKKGFEDMKKKPVKKPVRETTAMKIEKTVTELEAFLLLKNSQYGDSVLEPIRIFSKSDKSEQIKVRIDDKLNRLMQGNAALESDEDVIKDLIGYLVLLLIQMRE